MTDQSSINQERRLKRLQAFTRESISTVAFSSSDWLADPRPLVAPVSSRLGHDMKLHREVSRFLARRIDELRRKEARLLVAAGSAIEPLALRAAAIFKVPCVRIWVNKPPPLATDTEDSVCEVQATARSAWTRDAWVIALADFVDGIYVRQRGSIASCLRARIQAAPASSTRVAVMPDYKTAATELIAAGAIGWYFASEDQDDRSAKAAPRSQGVRVDSDDRWIHDSDGWLIHCTRGCSGAWPGETEHQYQDDLLIGNASLTERTAFDTLRRIARSGMLVANTIASDKRYPVVCFSHTSLSQRLSKRTFRPHLGRWDNEPYGVAIAIEAAKRIGIQPVIYGDPKDRKLLPEENQFRFQAKGKTYDWTDEHEWRSNGSVDLTQLGRNAVRLFVPRCDEAEPLRSIHAWSVTVLARARGEDC
ncbi:hypothetical protein [Novipirellula artificiosorum]|uniref:Uncharacterized protein n=1 Tax=Novipirellula artificiosorum TaxID=2528016 RepID=A0A5C6DXZ3_9BACT|nr:hypothetical protein [Novipirellula artificiosorum]TWU41114.1 hypothetical protein Poly41_19520 [Novipirellula artificiosorum]